MSTDLEAPTSVPYGRLLPAMVWALMLLTIATMPQSLPDAKHQSYFLGNNDVFLNTGCTLMVYKN